jgi:GGDEF domain-containing protein
MFSIIDLGGIVDPMTFAERPDRKQWVFDNAVRKAKKFNKQIYIIELDVSGFKGINDDPKHGHQTGDEVLRKIGSFLTQASYEPIPDEVDTPKQEGDKEPSNSFNIIRLGGDEFLVVEVGDNDDSLTKHKDLIKKTPEKMRAICSELGISYEEHPIVFHSGITIMQADQDPEDAIKQADQELIKNKAKYYEQNPHRTRRTA